MFIYIYTVISIYLRNMGFSQYYWVGYFEHPIDFLWKTSRVAPSSRLYNTIYECCADDFKNKPITVY